MKWRNYIKTFIGSIKMGRETNHTLLEEDGTLQAFGTAQCWDEISNSFIGRNLDSSVGRVDFNMTDLTLDFQDNARYPNEPVGNIKQMLHARVPDSDIRPHVHWMQSSDNVPNILIEYRWINNAGSPTPWTLKALTASDLKFTYDDSGDMQQISEFNLPAGHGVGKGLSVNFEVKIYRDSDDTSELFGKNDDYSGVWAVKYYDIHILKDMLGSREEFTK